MKKSIVLCADDYGQEIEISNGIYFLLEIGILSATSCLVTSRYWPEQGSRLRRFQSFVDIGLHFNLTEGKPISKEYCDTYGKEFFSLKELLLRASLRQLKPSVISAEFKAQLESFNTILNKHPDFIDGHQHIHQFPIIREALLSTYKDMGLTSYMRLVNPPITGGVKDLTIKLSGGYKMHKLYTEAQIEHNPSFGGIYNFNKADNYPHYFRNFLQKIGQNGIIMCHPANAKSRDPIGVAREKEYKYLLSHEFQRDCAYNQVDIRRWSMLSKYE